MPGGAPVTQAPETPPSRREVPTRLVLLLVLVLVAAGGGGYYFVKMRHTSASPTVVPIGHPAKKAAAKPANPVAQPAQGQAAQPAKPAATPAAKPAAVPADITKLPAQKILDLAREAMFAAGTAHVTGFFSVGNITVTYNQDAGLTSGVQHSVANGAASTVMVIGAKTFFQGDPVSLHHDYVLTAPQVHVVGNKWVSVAPTDALYTALRNDVTTTGLAAELMLGGDVATVPVRNVDNVPVIGVQGTVTNLPGLPGGVTETVFVPTSGTPTPVAIDIALPSGSIGNLATIHLDFSKWGEKVSVAAPASSITYASLAGARN